MQNTFYKIFLILIVLYSMFFFIGSTLYPIAAHFQLWEFADKISLLFIHACHRQPDRTFFIYEYPVALCCRCYGFYLGIIISGIFAFCNKLKLNKNTITIFIIISLFEVSISLIYGTQFNSGNITRFLVGIIMGMLLIKTAHYLFQISRKGEKI